MLRGLAVAESLQNADCSCEVALHPYLAEQGVLSDFSSHTHTQNATNTHIHKMNQAHTNTYFEMLCETFSQESGKKHSSNILSTSHISFGEN